MIAQEEEEEEGCPGVGGGTGSAAVSGVGGYQIRCVFVHPIRATGIALESYNCFQRSD